MGVKLTKPQYEMLQCAERVYNNPRMYTLGTFYPSKYELGEVYGTVATANALVKRGLLERPSESQYRITKDGLAYLSEETMNTWNCTRCETPHDAPALVMSESGLPFCNDLCKTAYERDLVVGEMCAQFDEAIKRLTEWREARELVFERLREPLKPTFNLERLIRRESELTASVHELLAIVELAAFYMPGELKEQPEKVHGAIERAQALVNEESYNVR